MFYRTVLTLCFAATTVWARPKGADRTPFELRRKMGLGYSAEGRQLENRGYLQSVWSTFRSMVNMRRPVDYRAATTATATA